MLDPHNPSRSYVAPYANSGRTSRVRSPVHLPTGLVAVAPIAPVPRPGFEPRFVMTSPGGEHVILDRHLGASIFDREGHTQGNLNKTGQGGYALRTDRFASSRTLFTWTSLSEGTMTASRYSSYDEKIWAIHLADHALLDIVQLPRERFRPEAQMLVTAFRVEPDGLSFVWLEQIDGYGCGAIGPDGSAAVAMEDGRFIVFAPRFHDEPDGSSAGRRALDTRLIDVPYDLAALDDGGYAAVCAADGPAAISGTGIDPAELQRERLASARDAQHAWRTRLVRLDARCGCQTPSTSKFQTPDSPDASGVRSPRAA